jgi:hypothetical protein
MKAKQTGAVSTATKKLQLCVHGAVHPWWQPGITPCALLPCPPTCLFTFCACFMASPPDLKFTYSCAPVQKPKARALLGIFSSLLTLMTYRKELLFTALISNISPTDLTVPPGFGNPIPNLRQSQWSRGLRHEPSSPARTLRSWVRIPFEAGMSLCVYSVCVVLCGSSGLATGWFLVQGVIPTVYALRNRKSRQGP